MFKLALDRLPSDEELCSQSTISRLENLPDVRALLRLGRALIEQYCASFRRVPKRIVLDIDDTFDRVHGGQQMRLFNGFHDDSGFQPIIVFDGEGRFVTAMLRPGKRPSGQEIRAFVRRLVGAIRALWPQGRDPLARRQSLCQSASVRLVPRQPGGFGLRPRSQRSALPPGRGVEKSTAEWFKAAPTQRKRRRFMQFYDAAQSWSRSSASSPGSRPGLREPIPASS
jgi:hypothetical protein